MRGDAVGPGAPPLSPPGPAWRCCRCYRRRIAVDAVAYPRAGAVVLCRCRDCGHAWRSRHPAAFRALAELPGYPALDRAARAF